MSEQPIINPSHVIDALGGTLAVAAERGLGASAVSMWRHNGIPGRHRLPILRLAEQRGIAIPDEAFDAPTSSRAPAPDASNDGGA